MANSREPLAEEKNWNSMTPPAATRYGERSTKAGKGRNLSDRTPFSVAQFYGCLCHRAVTDSLESEARPHRTPARS
jgi:hypothetical protein